MNEDCDSEEATRRRKALEALSRRIQENKEKKKQMNKKQEVEEPAVKPTDER
jgi:hypothetical protein